ncbi:toxin-antitoxin system, toxin component, RelE domain protein, partial [delta proteobacterium NaphS2]
MLRAGLNAPWPSKQNMGKIWSGFFDKNKRLVPETPIPAVK